jgi:hypothetical protein
VIPVINLTPAGGVKLSLKNPSVLHTIVWRTHKILVRACVAVTSVSTYFTVVLFIQEVLKARATTRSAVSIRQHYKHHHQQSIIELSFTGLIGN